MDLSKSFSPKEDVFFPILDFGDIKGLAWLSKGSDPVKDLDNDEDDIWTGLEGFSTFEEAENSLKTFLSKVNNFNYYSCAWGAIYEIETGKILLLIPPYMGRKKNLDDDWKKEFAMQQGMSFGCEAYNEAMGWNYED